MWKIRRGILTSLCMAGALGAIPAGNFAYAKPSAGESAYAANCAACHGEKLGGAFAPPLSGKAFKEKWQQQGSETMLAFIKTSMPPAKPGGLDAKVYADVTNYILARNGLALAVAGKKPTSAARTKEGGEGGRQLGRSAPKMNRLSGV